MNLLDQVQQAVIDMNEGRELTGEVGDLVSVALNPISFIDHGLAKLIAHLHEESYSAREINQVLGYLRETISKFVSRLPTPHTILEAAKNGSPAEASVVSDNGIDVPDEEGEEVSGKV
jgi:hypothetical protein